MLGFGLSLTSPAVLRGSGAGLADLDLDFLADPIDARLAVVRSGTATRFNASGLLELVPANTARIDHDPVTLARRGLLVEESRTNFGLRSEEFDHATWVKAAGATVTANAATAPDGALAADALMEVANTSNHDVSQTISAASGVPYTVSVHYKVIGSGTRWIILYLNALAGALHFNASGQVGTSSGSFAPTGTTISLGNGWYKAIMNVASPGAALTQVGVRLKETNNGPSGYTGNAAEGVLLWGFQIEAGAFATSYIPTTSATVTRAVDQVTVAVGDWFNASAGTIFADLNPVAVSAALQTQVYLDDTTANERMGIRASSSANAFLVVDGNAIQAQATIGTLTAGTATKVAMVYTLNDFAGVMNGGTVMTDAAGTVPTVTRLLIGSRLSGTEPVNAHFRRVRFFKTRKSNAEIQSLTA